MTIPLKRYILIKGYRIIDGDKIMAEFCVDCWNKLNETNNSEKRYVISDYLDLCEGCGYYKPVIIMERKAYYMRKFKCFIMPLKIIWYVLCLMCALLLLPLLLYKYNKNDM